MKSPRGNRAFPDMKSFTSEPICVAFVLENKMEVLEPTLSTLDTAEVSTR